MTSRKAYSFKKSVSSELDALRFFYRFMTCEFIFAQECSIFPKDDGLESELLSHKPSSMMTSPMNLAEIPELGIVTYTREDIESERKFRAKIIACDLDAIYCVGSFDKEDTKRVTAQYFAGTYSVVIAFPPNWTPTEEDIAVVTSLFDDL